ncbi:MAG TPA: RNA polymerase sigma-70 factor [Herpetosiphonaceae bacterium]
MIDADGPVGERRTPDTALAMFERERRRLFGIAYRMLGSVSEAEDIVQDAYVRWHAVAHERVENASAFLVRLVTRLCIDALKSARNRRTDYVGPWLPEPFLVSDGHADHPAAMLELADDLSMAFLLLLERLTPVERAVFLLHESFGFSYGEIAQVIGKSEQNCRQIARRARQHLDTGGHLAPADPQEHDLLLHHFLRATRDGDVQGMVQLLAHDAVLYADSGGKALAARNPISGADHIARYLIGLDRKFVGQLEVRLATINGRTGMLIYIDGQLQNVVSLLIVDGKIQRLFLVVNPDKLPHGPYERLAD